MPRQGHKRWDEAEPVEEGKAVDEWQTTPISDPDATDELDPGFMEAIYPPQHMDDLEKQVNKAIPQRYDSSKTQAPTIYVVPRELAEGNVRAYVPSVICIGPFFYKQRETASMLKLETYKWCCVRKLIVGKETAGRQPGTTADWVPDLHAPVLRKCLDTMMHLLPRIRASYDISTSMEYVLAGGDRSNVELAELMALLKKDEPESNEQLSRMMLLDGCFVLHRILKHARQAGTTTRTEVEDVDDDWTQVFGRRGIWAVVNRDLLLLNNQIPFFVLRVLFKRLGGNAADVLIDGGLGLFRPLHPPRATGMPPIACRKVRHLLHLFYLSITHLPPREDQPAGDGPLWVPCATELDEAGVRIRARKGGATSFLDIAFRQRGGVLEIPPLELFDYSEPLFRNLVALEQTDPRTPGHVTAYAIFMDCLVKTPEDMRLLHQRGVLVNHMNGESDVVTGFFSRVCAQAHASRNSSYLAGVMAEIVRYQSGIWPRWRAALARNYFTNPWVTTSVIAAGLVIALTVLQTFYSVYGYYKPHN